MKIDNLARTLLKARDRYKGCAHARRLSDVARGVTGYALVPLLAFAFLMVSGQNAQAQTETVLYSFGSKNFDGQAPFLGTLVRDKTGKLYGTTEFGGAHSGGSVFRITVSKTGKVTEKLLYSFTYSDGKSPYGGVILDKKGNLYGTTAGGGASGYGIVYSLTKKGVQKVLHSFSGPPGGGSDGAFPYGALVMDSKGNLYGTTVQGGTFGQGTVFEISSTGIYRVLYVFGGAPDGASPVAGLTIDAAGNLYGTTASGGIHSNSGTVYEITAGGAYSKLHDIDIFTGEGSAPWGGVVVDAAGNLYGATNATVFQLSPAGIYTVLYTLGTQAGDGSGCFASLVRDATGNLYGATLYGGTSANCQGGCGTVFEVTGPGAEKVLHSFTGNPDGNYSQAGLVMDPAGNLFGVTGYGGAHNAGSVFKVVP